MNVEPPLSDRCDYCHRAAPSFFCPDMEHNRVSLTPHPSLSRDLQSAAVTPLLVHSLHETNSSVLSLAANEDYIFSGSQNQDILVWDIKTFKLKCTFRGHKGSVLDLAYAKEKKWLFSSSGDSTVRVWSTETLEPLFLIDPYLETGAGDLLSLTWSSSLELIFVGCQNTSLQWFSFKTAMQRTQSSSNIRDGEASGVSTSNTSTFRKVHKFFDSYPQYERREADIHSNNSTLGKILGLGSPELDIAKVPQPKASYCIPPSNVIDSAHYGYIYCMAPVSENDQGIQIVTGSGDESVKVWSCKTEGTQLVHTFSFNHGAVLALTAEGDTVYAGCQDGYVKVLDLETKTLIRTIIVQEGIDILSVCRFGSSLYTCSANGWLKRWSESFDCVASWQAHKGIVLSSTIMKQPYTEGAGCLVTGGSDDNINIWDIEVHMTGSNSHDREGDQNNKVPIGSGIFHDTMLYALSKFIAIPSISSIPGSREHCQQAAVWLRKCLGQLGAHTGMLPTGEGINPIVFATFKGTIGDKPKRRVLFYGHYDVISAPKNGWTSDPFTMSGRNGFLYGRGSTDNKGPIIAVACAAANLLSRRALEVDLVFLIEGEAEHGNTGFRETVKKYKSIIGSIDAILISNSTWIGDDLPCITYGLRGVVQCTVEVISPYPDLHSGIEGGAVAEPMIDMIKLLGSLTDADRRVQIPGFYDRVRSQTKEEERLYEMLSKITQRPAALLYSRWAVPSLTVHNIESTGPKNATVIPGAVKAQLSLRIVPDQELESLVELLKGFLNTAFSQIQSPNILKISVDHTADWWLGKLDDSWFRSLESAVQEVWGVEPLRIREGGSIPSVPFLEKEFGCHALHLPMGQSSDQAHLPNERISLSNLQKGKAVIEHFLVKVGTKA